MLYAEPGYLLYVREQTLVAQQFDARSLALTGEPVPVGEGLGVDNVGLASFSVSRNGVLAYRAGDAEGRRLLWIDRSGKETPALERIGDYRDTCAVARRHAAGVRHRADSAASRGDLWMRDLVRGVTSRFTFDTGGGADAALVARRPPDRLHVARARARGTCS